MSNKLCELVSKITFTDKTQESLLKSLIDWTKNNMDLQIIQKRSKK